MGPAVVTLRKRTWLAGMEWLAHSDTPSKEEIKSDAASKNADWYAIRKGENCIQVGYAKAIDGEKHKTLVSLAAMLADSREQPWLGIFQLAENIWWYIAVRDHHAILPDGDVIGTRDEVLAARERHNGYGDWKYIEGDAAFLEEWIGDIRSKPTRISLVAPPSPLPLIVGAVVATAAAVGATTWWMNNQSAAEAAQRRAAFERVRAELVSQPIALPPSRALSQPSASDWLAECGRLALSLPLSQYGWSLATVECAGLSVAIGWARRPGATIDHRPEGSLSLDGEAVSQVKTFSTLEPLSEELLPMAEARQQMLALIQAADLQIVFSGAEASPQQLPGAPGTTIAVPMARPETAFTVDLKVSPFAMDLSAVPGLRIESLTMTEHGWTLKGRLYGA